ncbi:deoxyribose-phosphate aldolase [Bacillus pseudomycoides]|uniref:deoxyribose-phosphate aldolase n=1 Tax=Bacillus pseudomycoides TaxID=64104 RepID=UPI003F73384D
MNIAKLIDHTVLKPDTKKEDVMKVLEEAKKYNFASVCINPTWVKLAAEELAGYDVDVCTVIGFPLGANTTETKVFETKDVIAKGATEVDMVINVGALKDGDKKFVENDIREVVEAAKGKALVKVIIETCLLTDEEKVRACELSVKAGADFVKTSTGFSTGGATAEDIALMRKTVGENVGVKASGGVRTREDAEKMIEAGASRIGASASVAIVLDDKNGASDNY